MSIEFINESGYDGVNEEMLIDVCSYALGRLDVNPDAECTITAVDLDTIAELHVRWMDLEGPTDVMSFPMDELTPGATAGRPDAAEAGPAMLGDIVLLPGVCAAPSHRGRPLPGARAGSAHRAWLPAPAGL